ncbi:MAG: HflC protein [Elusimicrobia bacterium RIFCSPLOWO2_01_FULL_59_12]|nr:MAG: HflC protein [Elusimicrobia bacterium RIFCSPLOWO2_01_FULL_59_12]
MTPRINAGMTLAAVGMMLVMASVYRLPEWEQAVITQFGRPVGSAVTAAGLHLKVPFVQRVRRIDKRILNWDGYPNQIPTKDKKYIEVDTTARWRIVDPLLFIQTVQTEDGARRRLDGILDAITRDTISNHNLVEAVRNTNAILDQIKTRAEKLKKGEISPGDDEEITGEIEPVHVGREALSAIIIKRAAVELKQFGIELIDVQLRRIAYESSVEAKVYDRMTSERQRIAQRIRSVGQGERAKIQGKTNRDLLKIQSEAYRKAQSIKGAADAEAIAIYARAVSGDPQFYEFIRTLEAYKKAIPADTRMILSTDNKFLDLLRQK